MDELELMKAIQQYRNNCDDKNAITDYLIALPENFEKQDLEVQKQLKQQAIESLMSLTGINEFKYVSKISDLLPNELSKELIEAYCRLESGNNKISDEYEEYINLNLLMKKMRSFILISIFIINQLESNRDLKLIDKDHILERILTVDLSYRKGTYSFACYKSHYPLEYLEKLDKFLLAYYNKIKESSDKERYAISSKGLDLLTLPLSDPHSQYMKKIVKEITRAIYDNKIYPAACLDRIYDIWFSTSDEVKMVIEGINEYFEEEKGDDDELEPINNYVISNLLTHKKLPTSEELETFISGLSEWHSFQVGIVPFYPSKNSKINTCSIPCAIDMVSRREAILLLGVRNEMSENLDDYQNEVIRLGDEKWFIKEIKKFNQTTDIRRTSQIEAFNADNHDSNELVPIAYCFIEGADRFAIPSSVDIEPDKLKAIIKDLAQPHIKKSKIKVKSLKSNNF